jgi:hypothetical protein
VVLPKTNFDGCNRLQTDNITKHSCRTFYFRFHDLYATCFVVAHILLEFVWKFHSSSCQNVWKHIVLEILWSSLKRVLSNNEETNCSDINYKTQNAWQQGDVVVKFGIAFFYNPKTTMPPWRIEKKRYCNPVAVVFNPCKKKNVNVARIRRVKKTGNCT